MTEEDKAGGPRPRPRRDPRLPRPGLSRARRRSRRSSLHEMMDWLVVRGRARRVRAACCSRRWSSTGPTPAGSPAPTRARRRAAAVPGRGHRLRPVGAARRHPPGGGRHPVHDHREERRASAAPGARTRYPGARVDVGNHFYCYSFEPSDHWTEFFAQQPELQAYFERRAWTSTASRRTSASTPRCSARRGTTTTATWTVAGARRRRHRRRRSRRAP